MFSVTLCTQSGLLQNIETWDIYDVQLSKKKKIICLLPVLRFRTQDYLSLRFFIIFLIGTFRESEVIIVDLQFEVCIWTLPLYWPPLLSLSSCRSERAGRGAYIWITSIRIYKSSKQCRTLNYLFQQGIFKLFWGCWKASIMPRWLCLRFQHRILWIMNQQDVYIFFWFSTTEH